MLPIIKLDPGIGKDTVLRLVDRSQAWDRQIEQQVARIIEDVRQRGDQALFEYTKRFDRVEVTERTVRFAPEEFDAAYALVSAEFVEAMGLARDRIRAFHERQKVNSWFVTEEGALLGQIVRPIQRVGLYVPGGRAAYPSSVLMTAVPAIVAGVSQVAMCVPGATAPEVLVAAKEAGVEEVYRVGGAQAIAAFAYGTQSIPKVDKIFGPGNVYVTIAKKLVFGDVGIDMLAGPSEIVVIADETAEPVYVAADLLAQAEHDEEATPILIATSDEVAEQVNVQLGRQLLELSRSKIAKAALEKNGKALIVKTPEEAIELANLLAPEHLELMFRDAASYLDSITNAGAVFIGNYSAEAIGDYVAGPNHVLPTGGTARFQSVLGVDAFVKRTSVVETSKDIVKEIGPKAALLAQSEGLDAHQKSIAARLERS